ncbi:MAG: hypothetical protein LBL25_01140 [Oscillospiraceae bacterium]|jgi:flagellar biosynthesis/type III secretory pathway protein FliH|nr:hypothetical protein [Oscillospiraceae bacterium]
MNGGGARVTPLILSHLSDAPPEPLPGAPAAEASDPAAASEAERRALAEIEREFDIAREQIEAELASARAEAEAIISAAESEAGTLRADAARDAEKAREEAAERGYASGYADGSEMAKRDGDAASEKHLSELYDANRESIGGLFSSVSRELAAARAKLSDSVRALSMDIARKVVGNALREDENFTSMINAAIAGLDVGDGLTVRLQPEAAERLFPGGSAVLNADGLEIKATVIPDVTLSEYGLLIDFGGGDRTVRADAGADAQLDALDDALRQLEEDGDA